MDQLFELMNGLYRNYDSWPELKVARRRRRRGDVDDPGYTITIIQAYEGQRFQYEGIIRNGSPNELRDFCSRARGRMIKLTGQFKLGLSQEVPHGKH